MRSGAAKVIQLPAAPASWISVARRWIWPPDPQKRAEVRRVERALIGEYRALVDKALVGLSPESHARAVKLANLPDVIRGYEDIKLRNVQKFRDDVRALGF